MRMVEKHLKDNKIPRLPKIIHDVDKVVVNKNAQIEDWE
jgi:hypothetical protein